jgi:hypothetical protein
LAISLSLILRQVPLEVIKQLEHLILLAALFSFGVLVLLLLGHCIVEMIQLVDDGGLEFIVTPEKLPVLAFQILILLRKVFT